MPISVQSFWFGKELNALQALSIRSFLAHGHDYHLYSFDDLRNVPEGVRILDAATILPRDAVFTYQRGFGKGSVSAFSNYFRYKLLLEKGGWWVDADVVCLRPFEFEADCVFATERDGTGGVSAASCVIKTPAGADVMRYCVEECERADKSHLEWGEIGPRLMERAISRFALDQYRVSPDVFNPVDYHAFRDLLEPGFDVARLSAASAVHLWSQKWSTHYLDPDYPGAPDSLYALLREMYPDPAAPEMDRSGILHRHIDYQDCVIDALRTERDEALYALERESRRVESAASELTLARSALAEVETQLARTGHELSGVTQELNDTRTVLSAVEGNLAALESNLSSMQTALEAERTALAVARGEVGGMRNSLSWRLTRPLRWLYDRLVVGGRH